MWKKQMRPYSQTPRTKIDPDNEAARAHRRAGGLWFKELREKAGLSQRELAMALGIDYYTFISQLETGRGRLPPDRYEDVAKALNVEPKYLARGLMRFYDPITYRILFED